MSEGPRSTKHRDALMCELWVSLSAKEHAVMTQAEYERAEAMWQDSMMGRCAELKDALEDLRETFLQTREGRLAVRCMDYLAGKP